MSEIEDLKKEVKALKGSIATLHHVNPYPSPSS